jgi:hypothetical protein
VNDPEARSVAVEASSYEPADRYVHFELEVAEARCNGYGDVPLPAQKSWSE